MKKLWALLLCLAIMVPVSAFAANTVTYGYKQITIIPDGSTDWDVATYFPNGINLTAIFFQPSAANDKLAIEDKTATGGRMTPGIDVSGSGLGWYFDGSKRFPFLDASDCTFSTPGSCIITIYYK